MIRYAKTREEIHVLEQDEMTAATALAAETGEVIEIVEPED